MYQDLPKMRQASKTSIAVEFARTRTWAGQYETAQTIFLQENSQKHGKLESKEAVLVPRSLQEVEKWVITSHAGMNAETDFPFVDGNVPPQGRTSDALACTWEALLPMRDNADVHGIGVSMLSLSNLRARAPVWGIDAEITNDPKRDPVMHIGRYTPVIMERRRRGGLPVKKGDDEGRI
ncbi:hypothetical protein M404DRAFT_5828 [Pisolithus tinctorius Marx 270]|uniref:Uncharacterized protein n=1 Tax=Pisolithus tinctorius Marx 270 TaxID=870435 RepID=A0A0C3PJZ8_PISTI|nr:hypothetical protein M404DRAFT_5828 [Pisolithus tinctorius Marx 270]